MGPPPDVDGALSERSEADALVAEHVARPLTLPRSQGLCGAAVLLLVAAASSAAVMSRGVRKPKSHHMADTSAIVDKDEHPLRPDPTASAGGPLFEASYCALSADEDLPKGGDGELERRPLTKTLAECRALCCDTPGCKFYTFTEIDQDCLVYGSCPAQRTFADGSRGTSTYRGDGDCELSVAAVKEMLEAESEKAKLQEQLASEWIGDAIAEAPEAPAPESATTVTPERAAPDESTSVSETTAAPKQKELEGPAPKSTMAGLEQTTSEESPPAPPATTAHPKQVAPKSPKGSALESTTASLEQTTSEELPPEPPATTEHPKQVAPKAPEGSAPESTTPSLEQTTSEELPPEPPATTAHPKQVAPKAPEESALESTTASVELTTSEELPPEPPATTANPKQVAPKGRNRAKASTTSSTTPANVTPSTLATSVHGQHKRDQQYQKRQQDPNHHHQHKRSSNSSSRPNSSSMPTVSNISNGSNKSNSTNSSNGSRGSNNSNMSNVSESSRSSKDSVSSSSSNSSDNSDSSSSSDSSKGSKGSNSSIGSKGSKISKVSRRSSGSDSSNTNNTNSSNDASSKNLTLAASIDSAARAGKSTPGRPGPRKTSKTARPTTTTTTSTQTTTTTQLVCPRTCTPKERVVPDIVIPFFERDLCKLKYTAKSLGAHDPNRNLGDVYLMWVSTHPASDYKDDLAEVVKTLSKSRKVNLIDFSLAMQSYDLDGWHAQQLLKLKIASVVKSDFYLVMDSKNTLIKDIEDDTFFNKCNQARIFAQYNYTEIPSPHIAWYEKAARTLGVDPPLDKPYPASITPILLHRRTVLDMLAHVGEGSGLVKLCDGPLCTLFGVGDASGQGTTEFTMYNMYAYAKTKLECTSNPEFHHIDSQDQWGLSLWRGVAENKEQVMKENMWTLKNITQGILQPIMFGSQPSALDDLSNHQRKEAEKLLEEIYEDAGAYEKGGDMSVKELIDCAIGSYEYGKNEKKFN